MYMCNFLDIFLPSSNFRPPYFRFITSYCRPTVIRDRQACTYVRLKVTYYESAAKRTTGAGNFPSNEMGCLGHCQLIKTMKREARKRYRTVNDGQRERSVRRRYQVAMITFD